MVREVKGGGDLGRKIQYITLNILKTSLKVAHYNQDTEGDANSVIKKYWRGTMARIKVMQMRE